MFAIQPTEEDHKMIFEGIRKHYHVDAIFHNSESFHFFSNSIKITLQNSNLPSLRSRGYFLAHIFLELLLDRMLVKHYPDACVSMYDDLRSVNSEVMASYFSRIGRMEFITEFLINFNRVLKARHLPRLADNEFFAEALLRAYLKINPVQVSRDERKTLMSMTEYLENKHGHQLSGVFAKMHSSLAAAA